MRCETTTSALANAALTAVSSIDDPSGATPVPLGTNGTARLFAKSLWMTAGLPSIACSTSTTAGSDSYDTLMASAASRAITTATGSPAKRTVSTATARCSGDGNGVPIGIGGRNSAISAPVNTAST